MLYIIGFGIAFFLAVILFSKKDKSLADYVLAVWLGVIGIHLLLYYLFVTGSHTGDSIIIPLGSPLPLVHGPFLYLYTIISTATGGWKGKYILHFLPAAFLYVCYFGLFFTMQSDENVFYTAVSIVQTVFVYLSGIIYVALSLRRLLRYRRSIVHQFSNTERINFNWLLYLIIWIAFIWLLVLILREDTILFAAVVCFVIWLGYFGIKQVSLFSQVREDVQEKPLENVTSNNEQLTTEYIDVPVTPVEQEDPRRLRYQKSALSEISAQLIHSQLVELMKEQKLFKNPELTLNELAAQLNVHPNNLSQVINSRENKNFYDYINGKRMEEFLQLVGKPESKKYTLLSLALECGFNSKAAFNRNFKKMTGLTPSEYIRQMNDPSLPS